MYLSLIVVVPHYPCTLSQSCVVVVVVVIKVVVVIVI